MIQATVALADFMLLLMQAAFLVALTALGWAGLAAAGVGACWFGLRRFARRCRQRS